MNAETPPLYTIPDGTDVRLAEVSTLRKWNATFLRENGDVQLIVSGLEPIAALVPYATFMRWQTLIRLHEAK